MADLFEEVEEQIRSARYMALARKALPWVAAVLLAALVAALAVWGWGRYQAQAIAKATDTSLITVNLSDEIFRKADLQLEPRPLTKDRDATTTFYQHHQIIEEQRQGQPLGLLIAGIKKDVVLTNRLQEKANRVAIYGWHYPDGKPIQPLYVGHVNWHVDYSHGIRLISQHMIVDDQPRRVQAK